MRIIAGRWAGRHLTSPGGRVRPTSEAVRTALFEWLEPVLEGARVLDLFAGTGALGLEALSRGAVAADFVEFGAPALHALKANVAALRGGAKGWGRDAEKRPGIVRVFKQDALRFVADPRLERYDLVFADPPYGSALGARLAERWLEAPFSRVLVIEHAEGVELGVGGAGAGGAGAGGAGAGGAGGGAGRKKGFRVRHRTLGEGTAVTRFDV